MRHKDCPKAQAQDLWCLISNHMIFCLVKSYALQMDVNILESKVCTYWMFQSYCFVSIMYICLN